MRSEQIRMIEAVHRQGSFQGAAAELGLTQPAIGDAVRRLETELNVQLFDRDTRGARLTRSGEIALRHARTIMKAERALRLDLDAELRRENATLRIGTIASHMSIAVLPALHRCRRELPSLEAQVIQGGAYNIRESVLCGDLDIGLFGVLQGDSIDDDLAILAHLGRSRLVALASPSHELAKLPEVDAATFLQYPIVMLPPGYLRSLAIRRLAAGRTIYVSCDASDTHSANLMIASSLGVGVTAELSARHSTVSPKFPVAEIPFEPQVMVEFVLAAHRALAATKISEMVTAAVVSALQLSLSAAGDDDDDPVQGDAFPGELISPRFAAVPPLPRTGSAPVAGGIAAI